jgi:hypothetical protein
VEVEAEVEQVVFPKHAGQERALPDRHSSDMNRIIKLRSCMPSGVHVPVLLAVEWWRGPGRGGGISQPQATRPRPS